MTNDLVQKKCAPCHGGVAPLKGTSLEALHRQVPGWQVIDDHHLQRLFRFPDFASALAFVNRVGAVAEQEQHHPDISLGWGRAEITTYTHSIGGLSENDFILAAKIDRVFETAG